VNEQKNRGKELQQRFWWRLIGLLVVAYGLGFFLLTGRLWASLLVAGLVGFGGTLVGGLCLCARG
jgi:hypothetical protein